MKVWLVVNRDTGFVDGIFFNEGSAIAMKERDETFDSSVEEHETDDEPCENSEIGENG